MAEARNKLVCGADSIFKDPSKAAAFAASLKSARFSDEAIQKLPNLEKYRGQRVSIAAVGMEVNGLAKCDELLFLVSMPSDPDPLAYGHYFATALTDMSTDPVTIGATTEIHEYAFDVRLSCAVRVKATSKAEAIKLLDRIQGNSANLGSWPNGEPILAEVSTDESNPYCFEIDGESAER